MPKRATGRYERTTVGGEEVAAFVPHALPPVAPPFVVDAALTERLRAAEQALVRLELAGEMVPSLDWFIYAFVRKEAVLSSQIEGTQTTLVDLLTFEAQDAEQSTAPNADVEEVCNYLDALAYARAQLADPKGLPLSMRLLSATHQRLMRGVRGAEKLPGEVRRSQNWIGGSRPGNAAYVPPPPHALGEVLGAFENYLHADDSLPSLVRAGFLHAQFETIHPYLDGNGRIGRLLVTLLLEHWKLLTKPLLYLSLFFKEHRQEYYRLLDLVRTEGNWEAWLDFFLEGVEQTATNAVDTATRLQALMHQDERRIHTVGRMAATALRVFRSLCERPLLTLNQTRDRTGLSFPAATKAMALLTDLGMVQEITGQRRNRVFAYRDYLAILNEGTEVGG